MENVLIRIANHKDYEWMMKAYIPLQEAWRKAGEKVNFTKKQFKKYLKAFNNTYVTSDEKAFLLANVFVNKYGTSQFLVSIYSENGKGYQLFKYADKIAENNKFLNSYAKVNDLEKPIWEKIAKRLKAELVKFNDTMYYVKGYR